MKYSPVHFHSTVWYILVSLYPQSCLLPTGYGGVWELNWKLETLIWHQDMILLYPGYCLPGFKTSLALPVTNGVPLTHAISNPPTTTCNYYWCTKVYKTLVACFKETFEGRLSNRTYNSLTSVKRTAWPDTQCFKHVGIKKVFCAIFLIIYELCVRH